MGSSAVWLTYDCTFSVNVGIGVFETVLQVARNNWLEATDEWSLGYKPPVDVLNGVDGALQVLQNMDFSKPDHSDACIQILHSPVTNYEMWCFVEPNRGADGLYDPCTTKVMLRILPDSFYEQQGYRAKMRLERGWQACREPVWGDNAPWEQMPPRTPEFSRWWRNYEEACAATEDVGEKNFACFMRIVNELKKLYPVISYEEDDIFSNYESVPAEKARWGREDAQFG